jgi:hypothetical protein
VHCTRKQQHTRRRSTPTSTSTHMRMLGAHDKPCCRRHCLWCNAVHWPSTQRTLPQALASFLALSTSYSLRIMMAS